MPRRTALLSGLAIATMALLLTWTLSPPAGGPPPPPAGSGSPTASSGRIESETPEWFPQPEQAVTIAPPENLSKDALVALVVSRLREWEDQDDSESRPGRIRELNALLDRTNMLEIVQGLPPDLMGFAFASPSLRQRLISDPKAALDWMSSHANISEMHLLTLIHDWAQQDREAMRQYLAALLEGDWKQEVVATASQESLSSDPVEAVVWATRMSPGERQTGLLEMATTDWAKRDPVAAALWIGEVNDPDLQERLAGSLAAGYAELDPLQAADWVIQSVPPGEVLDRSVAEIVWALAMREPAAAGAWVAQFPEGHARQLALVNLMDVWGNHDRTAAMAWIEGLPGGYSLRTEATELLAAIPPLLPGDRQ